MVLLLWMVWLFDSVALLCLVWCSTAWVVCLGCGGFLAVVVGLVVWGAVFGWGVGFEFESVCD